METIKLIELIIKLANNEEVPKKIKWDNTEYEFSYASKNYISDYSDLFSDITGYYLNDEVEIIEEEKEDNFTGWRMYQDGKEVCSMDCSVEEDKEIEKLDIRDDGNTITLFNDKEWTILDNVDILFGNKINELIDKVNNMENNK